MGIDKQRTGRWELSLFPDAGEAGGSFRWVGRPLGEGMPDPDRVVDPDRSMSEAARRAVVKVRRYCASNGLNRLGTLTYRGEGCHEPRVLRSDLGGFFRRLRSGVGERFAYVWVPEWHKSGHGLHAHFAVGRFIPRGVIDQAWGHGFVHIKLIGNLPVGSGVRAEARSAARYLSKYLSKDPDRSEGLNRYDLAQGFQPASEGLVAATEGDVIRLASDRMGAAPAFVWRSINEEGWRGPPALALRWD